MNQVICKVTATWDGEADVWVAESEDVPGLVTEAETLELLTQKLKSMVPELLRLNQVIPGNEESVVVIDLISRRQELVQSALNSY